ncbi:MAG: hypothetical protein QXP27_02550 [Candidatus Methanomethyliaceae archaeon]
MVTDFVNKRYSPAVTRYTEPSSFLLGLGWDSKRAPGFSSESVAGPQPDSAGDHWAHEGLGNGLQRRSVLARGAWRALHASAKGALLRLRAGLLHGQKRWSYAKEPLIAAFLPPRVITNLIPA